MSRADVLRDDTSRRAFVSVFATFNGTLLCIGVKVATGAGIGSIRTSPQTISERKDTCCRLIVTAMSLMIEVEECFTLTDLPELELAFGDRRIAEIAFTTAKHAHGTILHLTGRVEHVNGPNAIEVKVFSGAPHF